MGPARSKTGTCGLCGANGKLTRTHVPPQGIGNRNAVARRQVIASDGRAKDGRPLEGGIHVHGLCETCNGRAGQWDPAYIALHRALSPPYFAESRLQLAARIATPDVQIDLGAAVRSMLAAAFALNPGLRSKACPELAELLVEPGPFTLPAKLEVRLAWAIGRLARVTGSVSGHYVLGYNGLDRTIGNLIAAQVHYAPIAWQLAFAGETDLCDVQGWADISG